MKRFLLLTLALTACQMRTTPDAEGPGPSTLVHPLVDGAEFQVDVGLVYDGRAGTVHVTDYLHPELEGNEALARRVAIQACQEIGESFDESVAGEAWGKASWGYVEACR